MDLLREKLNKIDHYCIDNNKHFYDLRSLYEAVSPSFTPKDKMELKRVINATNDPAIIQATLQQLQNESLEEDALDEDLGDLFGSNYLTNKKAIKNATLKGIKSIRDKINPSNNKNSNDNTNKNESFDEYDDHLVLSDNDEMIDYDDDDYDAWQMGHRGRFNKYPFDIEEEPLPFESLNETAEDTMRNIGAKVGKIGGTLGAEYLNATKGTKIDPETAGNLMSKVSQTTYGWTGKVMDKYKTAVKNNFKRTLGIKEESLKESMWDENLSVVIYAPERSQEVLRSDGPGTKIIKVRDKLDWFNGTAEDVYEELKDFYNDDYYKDCTCKVSGKGWSADLKDFLDAYENSWNKEECLTESEDEAWPYEEVEYHLKKSTKNFTVDEGNTKTYYKSEKDSAKDILRKHYKVVEVSDGRRGPDEEMCWVISYSTPIKTMMGEDYAEWQKGWKEDAEKYGLDPNYDPYDDKEAWEYIDSKRVQDSDGFLTDYTLYYNVVTDEYGCVFGDNDIYVPWRGGLDDGPFETEEEAREWFNSYDMEELVDWDIDESFETVLGTVGKIAGKTVGGMADGPLPVGDKIGGKLGSMAGKFVGKQLDKVFNGKQEKLEKKNLHEKSAADRLNQQLNQQVNTQNKSQVFNNSFNNSSNPNNHQQVNTQNKYQAFTNSFNNSSDANVLNKKSQIFRNSFNNSSNSNGQTNKVNNNSGQQNNQPVQQTQQPVQQTQPTQPEQPVQQTQPAQQEQPKGPGANSPNYNDGQVRTFTFDQVQNGFGRTTRPNNESLKESVQKWTATDIVRDLYNKYPNISLLDEYDRPNNRVALIFKLRWDVNGLTDLLDSYNVDYSIRNGKLCIIADEDEEYEECLTESDDTPWSYNEVMEYLAKETNQGKKESGTITAYIESEKDDAKKILKRFYKFVDVSDGRTSKDDVMNWVIAYSNPIKRKLKEQVNKELYDTLYKNAERHVHTDRWDDETVKSYLDRQRKFWGKSVVDDTLKKVNKDFKSKKKLKNDPYKKGL